jgi:hypothetical protein
MTTALQKAYYGGQLVKVVSTSASTYTCDSGAQGDYVVAVTPASSGTTVTLPASTSAMVGRQIIVKDVAGTANTKHITIEDTSGDVDGASTYVLNLAYSGVVLTCTSSGNWSVTASYNGTVI